MTLTLEISPQSYAAFRATRCGFPAQLGRMTLQNAAELHDAIGNIVVCCDHAFQYAGYAMAERHRNRLATLRGDTLSLAQAVAVVALWKRWTWPDSFPTLIHAESFIHALDRP